MSVDLEQPKHLEAIMENSTFPWEIQDLKPEEAARFEEHFNSKGVRVGPKGYVLPIGYRDFASDIYNMKLKSTDVIVIGYPRSGTNVTEEMVWLLENNLDFNKAKTIKLKIRSPYLERLMIFNAEKENKVRSDNSDDKEYLKFLDSILQPPSQLMASLSSPRVVKTHDVPISLLPSDLLDTAKVVYIARDPRDVVVSIYHFIRNIGVMKGISDFKMFWVTIIQNNVLFTPYFDHVKEAWEKRHNSRMLFLFYEELRKNLPATIHRVAAFLEKQITDDELIQLNEHLTFDNLKKNPFVNDPTRWRFFGKTLPEDSLLIRRGKVGGWRDYFDEEMALQAEQWIADNLRGTDLRFPCEDGALKVDG